MKVAVFTAAHPRHFALLRSLSEVADEVLAVQECETLFPGQVQGFYTKSEIMARYFSFVRQAERTVFGEIAWLPKNVRVLALREGDINRLPVDIFHEALEADRIIVYGASFLRDPLCSELVKCDAINIHLGASPYYRGASCNFWAMYDGRFDLVGATIHRLSTGLDSGAILFHAFPEPMHCEPFEYGMRCVKAAQVAVTRALGDGGLDVMPEPQNRALEIRYAKNAEFTDSVASEYLAAQPSPDRIYARCANRTMSDFVRPRFEAVGSPRG